MSSADCNAATGDSELRERLLLRLDVPQQSKTDKSAKKNVLELNATEDPKEEKEKKTFGRTPDGVIFTVPQTHDMVSQLLSPSEPKNISDIVVILVLLSLAVTCYILPSGIRIPYQAAVFLFWRACYNGGIGYLLHIQSNHRRLTAWAKKSGILEDPSTGKNPHPALFKVLKREMETKIPNDYKFENAPLEYNTWLLFRRVVDLILMCDFTSYCLFAIACGGTPAGEVWFMTIARWMTGIALIMFNLWVKLDAHRVVKDYAWYWGDFFYLIDQELTFDGVFEMAPHPMYSVGYAGWYGISLLAASYKVLFISLIGHAAQFAFLAWVESPHIEKTYNPPPKKRPSMSVHEDDRPQSPRFDDVGHVNGSPLLATSSHPSPVHNFIGLQNIDLHRVPDISVLLFQFYLFSFTALTPSTTAWQTFFVINALVWRLWYSIGIGYILDRQSNKKNWTRHFIKYGESTEEAWRQWKGVYHLSMTLCYTSFVAAAWKMYTLPPDWEYGWVLLRHVIGFALIALHLWTITSIYESLGEFGWFFGDFFFDYQPKLTYSGIYRFLNNPERFLGLAGVWGLACITWSRTIFCLALMSHVLTLSFLQLIEKPHMQKLYGQTLRQHSGLTKSIQRSLPKPIRQWHGQVDRVLGETIDFVEEFLDSARPKLASGVQTIVKDTTAIFKQYPARISITRLAPDIAGYNPKDYSIEIEGTPSSHTAELDKRSGREGPKAREPAVQTGDFKTLMFEFGTPIKVKWTAPLNHSKKDWIGLYMVADNASRDVTRVGSQGRWIATNKGEFDYNFADEGILVSDNRVSGASRQDGETADFMSGQMVFAGDKLWWTTGVFEFRYHHSGAHNVMAISLPFEIRIAPFDEDDVEVDSDGQIRGAVEKSLLPVVQNCFDRDPGIAPSTVEEPFGSLIEHDGKFSKRVVFAVRQMFGIEFAPEVVQADGSVRNLAWRVCNAKKVLAPYSMSSEKGNTTPSAAKY
ncbi:phosphatidylethanolamine N-methyltransferase [Pseudovirgaria hyperparasitica]|uniref:Phosphatidylethanolamine N-methyltransferase n=1 Tax=Pseudovirgaria hyperparasitica TaxID=470096 RepID=A0A6A6VXQ6_9PEZI|nr:phosphatidylethanolamine N-methyltransferase [Pseudovirgaria hyperparasitica]KAF2754586.1 phosphatidylethanolamine N-methyltransferase [Pseudovirgaria hyperparasitica]